MNALVLVAAPPAVVTTTVLAPAVPAGVTAVMEVDDTTRMLVAATPPTVTLLAPGKFVPVMVIAVAPSVEPVVGLIAERVGTGTKYLNALASVALPPPVVTATSFKPTVPAGVHAEIMVGVRTTTLVAATPPTVTLVKPVTKLAPVMLILVDPKVEPVAGVTLAIVGGV